MYAVKELSPTTFQLQTRPDRDAEWKTIQEFPSFTDAMETLIKAEAQKGNEIRVLMVKELARGFCV